MTLEEIKAFINENKDNEEVQNYVAGFVTQDRVEDYLQTDEGKKLLQPKLDQYFTKGLETWKSKNLQKIVDEKIDEKYPAETEQEKRIKALEQRLAQEEKNRHRQEIEKKAIKRLTDEKLPISLADFITAEDDEELEQKFTYLKGTLDKWAKEVVGDQYKQRGRTPNKPTGFDENEKNPWSEKDWNLTEQGRLVRENPELATYLKNNTRS